VGGEPHDDGMGAILGELLVVGIIAHMSVCPCTSSFSVLSATTRFSTYCNTASDVHCKVDLLKSKSTP
jgi:hypothetical protein